MDEVKDNYGSELLGVHPTNKLHSPDRAAVTLLAPTIYTTKKSKLTQIHFLGTVSGSRLTTGTAPVMEARFTLPFLLEC